MGELSIELLEKIASDPMSQTMAAYGVTIADLAKVTTAMRRENVQVRGQLKTLNSALQGCREMLADAVHQGHALLELPMADLDPYDEARRAQAAKRLKAWDRAGLTGIDDPLTDPVNVVTFALAFEAMVADEAGADYLAAVVGPTGKAPSTGILITHSAKATAVLQAAMEKIDSYNTAHDHPKRSFERKGQRQAS